MVKHIGEGVNSAKRKASRSFAGLSNLFVSFVSFSLVKRVAGGCDAGIGDPGSKEFHNFHGILGSGLCSGEGWTGVGKNATELMGD